mgnify:CR=1 FL=1
MLVHEVIDAITTAHRIGTDELLDALLVTRPDVVEERVGPPGAEDPARIVLRQTRGLRRRAEVGTVEAALAGVCDGELPLRPLLAAIAELTGADPDALIGRADELRTLIAEGFFQVTGVATDH